MKFLIYLILLLTSTYSATNPRSYRIVTINEKIHIDGILDESIWQTIQPATDFIQKEPNSGLPSRKKTEVRLAIDDEYIYIGAYLFDSDRDSIAEQIIHRDGWGYSDWFAVGFDSYFDKRTCFAFWTNPKGSMRDIIHFNDTDFDESWDAVWEVRSTILSDGWCTEMKIPLTQLRYNPTAINPVWGLNFYRNIARYDENSFWSPILIDSEGFVSEFGRLEGMILKKQNKRIEVLPYISGLNKVIPGSSFDPFWEENNLSGNLGVDFKIGIGSNITVTGTVNPDFGQIEADPAYLNLTAYETFFEELRPFFLEGTDIFQFGTTRSSGFGSNSQNLFYSRRIGRSPRGYISDSDNLYESYPSQTNIISALKITGKTTNGFSLGILNAITSKEDARYIDSLGIEQKQAIEPLSNSFIMRLKQDIDKAKFIIGSFFTHRYQDLSVPYLDSTFLSNASLFGIDFEYTLPNPSWIMSGVTSWSQIKGKKNVITDIQRGSAHYYQQPGDDNFVDSSKTKMDGSNLQLSITKISGENITGTVTFTQSSPDYDINELGYMRMANIKKLNTQLTYSEKENNRFFNFFAFNIGTNHYWDYQWGNGNSGMRIDSWIRLNNWYQIMLEYRNSFGGYNRTITRGGPVASIPTYHMLGLRIRSDERKKIQTSFKINNRNAEDGEYDRFYKIDFNYRPNPRWEIELELFLKNEYDEDQYISTIEDNSATQTYGNRYIFSDITNNSKGISFEASMLHSPKLSFQFFFRPEFGNYHYQGLKEFKTPGKFDFHYYDIDQITEIDSTTIEIDPDGEGQAQAFTLSKDYLRGFNFLSLRSNFILKWEFKPGSTMYLVWQQQRDHYEVTDHILNINNGVKKLFKSESINTFMVKIAYWLSS